VDEGHNRQRVPPGCVLAAEGLGERRQGRVQQLEHRTSHQLVDAAAGAAAGVAPLHHHCALVRHQRGDEAGHVRRIEVDEVGVAEHDHLALRLGHALPHGLAFAGTSGIAPMGQHEFGVDDPCPGVGCQLRRLVARSVVDDQYLDDLRAEADEAFDDRSDGGRLVASRNHDAHGRLGSRLERSRLEHCRHCPLPRSLEYRGAQFIQSSRGTEPVDAATTSARLPACTRCQSSER